MKVAVVGGTGNISTSIVSLLLDQGNEVVCLNRGVSRALPTEVRLIQVDRHNEEQFEKLAQQETFEAAIDMICFNAAEAASSLRAFRGVKHFVHCSTVCTYGIDPTWLPVTEDHPLRPISDYGRGKVKADALFLEAYYREGFPVTILKPSTTYGPIMGCVRQVCWDLSFLDRIRKGKPILICGDGTVIHQFLHVRDAAQAFVHILGKDHCVGQTYHVVNRGFHTWRQYHRVVMQVLGREVEMVGVPLEDLSALEVPEVGLCKDIFAHNSYYSPERLFRDVPEYRPVVSLQAGLTETIAALEREGRIPNSDDLDWEDRVIHRAQRS